MRICTTTLTRWMVGLALAAAPTPRACAQAGGGYDLSWSSLDCGSPVFSSGGGYLLGGTTGQAESGNLAGGGYALQGGFRQGSLLPTDAPPPDATDATALVFRLHGNAPNPFASTTAIAFSTARATEVRLRIYDLGGRVVRTVLDRQLDAGHHQAAWDGNDDSGHHVANGIYFLRLQAGSYEARKKIVLLR